MIACWHPCGIVYESYMLRCRDSTGRHRERLYRTRTGRAESEQNCSHGELTTAEAMRCGSPRSKPNARETTAHTASAEVGAGQAGRRCVSGNGWPPGPAPAPQRSVDGNILFSLMAAIVMRPVGKYSGILRSAVRGCCGYNAQALARPSCHRQQIGVVHDAQLSGAGPTSGEWRSHVCFVA